MLQDHLRSIRNYYYRAPQFAKNIIGGGYRLLPTKVTLGRRYSEFISLLNESESWNRQKFDDFQFEQLRNTLLVAYHHTNFYRRKFDEFGLTPDDFRYLDDIAKFPMTTKREIKANLDKMVNTNIPKWKRLTTSTGGSTSEPMRFYQEKGVQRSKEKAFIGAGWARIGYHYGARAIQLKGRAVGDASQKILWEFEPIQNILEMDSSHLTAENIRLYLGAMNRFKAEFLIGFPSAVYLLAKYLVEENLSPPNFQSILLASENIYPWQRSFIEQVFHCRTFSHYGHSEMVLLGMESKDNHNLLFFPHYGLMEVIDSDGKIQTLPGQKGELIGTSFHNSAMPFIRYRTQDIGVIGEPDSQLPHYPALQDIEGRLQEFVVTADGRYISVCTIGAAHFDNLENVLETQYYQDEKGRLEFRVVPSAQFSESDRTKIHFALQSKVGNEMAVNVLPVSRIEKTRTGKHMMLIQKIPNFSLNFEATS